LRKGLARHPVAAMMMVRLAVVQAPNCQRQSHTLFKDALLILPGLW
jgi:hypothetical protein